MTRSLPTRLLHLLLAAAIVHQLAVSLLMQKPEPGTPENLGFELHQGVGLASAGILVIFWLWLLVRRREHGIAALVPWFSAARRGAVAADLARHGAALKKWALPSPAEETPLASAVHGLGLLVATGMAATGVVIYATMAPDGTLSGVGSGALNVHSLLANLMWAFLVGHAALAVWHQMKGHDVLKRMFSLKKPLASIDEERERTP